MVQNITEKINKNIFSTEKINGISLKFDNVEVEKKKLDCFKELII